jgi:hypothetical protein
MNPNHLADDRLADALSTLSVVDVEATRAGDIRDRCRAALGHRVRGRKSWAVTVWPAWRGILEPALVAGLSTAFLLEVVARALSLEGF